MKIKEAGRQGGGLALKFILMALRFLRVFKKLKNFEIVFYKAIELSFCAHRFAVEKNAFDMEPKGRNNLPLFQRLRQGALLCRLIVESSTVLVTLTVPALAVLVPCALCVLVSCDRDDYYTAVGRGESDYPGDDDRSEPPTEEEYDEVVVIDSLKTKLSFYKGSKMDCGISSLDYFIYSTEGTCSLESYNSLTITGNEIAEKNLWSAAEVSSASASPRTVVAIANCPRALNMDAIRMKDSMDLLEFAFQDDDPSHPVLSGSTVFTPGGSATVELLPLMAQVRICSVTNGLRGYQLLEDPSVRLCDLNPSAKVLQFSDFHPVEFIGQGELFKLPTDVGFYTQHPDISLFCYPNDAPETTLGLPSTSLEFNCRIEGTDYSFPFDLPPLSRGSVLDVDLIIDNPFSRRAIFTD